MSVIFHSKKITIIFQVLLLIFNSHFILAQTEIDMSPSKAFQEAEYFFLYEEYKEALPLYMEALSANPANANFNYRVGQCLLNIEGMESKAISYFLTATVNVSKKYKEGSFKEKNAPVATYFYLGKAYQINNEYNKAIHSFEKYKELLDVKDTKNIDYVNDQIEACHNARTLRESPTRCNISNLGKVINNSFPNFNAVVSADGKSMAYMSSLQLYDALFYSTYKNGAWNTPRNINPEIISDGEYYCTGMSYDGTDLYLCKQNIFNYDLYVSHLKEGKWTPAEKLNNNINTKYWESHASPSADDKTLYFTSNRNKGYGELDIYKSERTKDGEWGPAVNLGNTINTPYNEETPFISSDGKTLFFSSQGHFGSGGFDVFYSTISDSGEWTVPINIGYPINTTSDDLFYCPANEGLDGYIAKINNKGYGKNDIFFCEIIPETKTHKIDIQGNISLLDNIKEFGKDFDVIILDSKSKDTLTSLTPDWETGRFAYSVNTGNYKIIFKGKDYKTEIKNVIIPEDYKYDEFNLNIQLVPKSVESGKYFAIKSILFKYNDYSLTREAKIELERLLSFMKEHPTLYLEVIGHTDSKGHSNYNKELSRKRARSVIDYLVNRGIAPERFVAKAAGEDELLAKGLSTNGTDNPEGRKYNRRVDIKVLKSDENIIFTQKIDIPAHLKRKKYVHYTIFLGQDTINNKLNDIYQNKEIDSSKINIHQENSKYFYTHGNYFQKSEALKDLNNYIKLGYDDAEIITNLELEERIKSGGYYGRYHGNTFTVQVRASKKPYNKKLFKELDNITEYRCDDGYYRYTCGKYEGFSNAKKSWKKIVDLGYTDAFIMNIQRYEDSFKMKDDVLSSKDIKTLKGEEPSFTIQICALKTPVGKDYFKKLKEIKMSKGDDGFFRYTYGAFKNYEYAKLQLKIIHENGYPEAYIRKIKNIPGY